MIQLLQLILILLAGGGVVSNAIGIYVIKKLRKNDISSINVDTLKYTLYTLTYQECIHGPYEYNFE